MTSDKLVNLLNTLVPSWEKLRIITTEIREMIFIKHCPLRYIQYTVAIIIIIVITQVATLNKNIWEVI